MNRSELLTILRRAEPALAVREISPAYTNLYFDGEFAYANDGLVSIRTPCAVDIKGGVRGNQLIAFLSACSSENIKEITVEGNTFTVKVGGAKLQLPFVALSTNPGEPWAPAKPDGALKFTEACAAAVKACGVTLGVDPSMPSLLGITVNITKKSTAFCSGISHAVTVARVEEPPPKGLIGTRVLLPVRFCELILATRPAYLDLPAPGFGKEDVEASYGDGTRIRAATLAEDVDLSSIEQVEGSVTWEGFATFKKKMLIGAIERACVLLGNDEQKECEFVVEGEKLIIRTKGDNSASLVDFTMLTGGHAGITVRTRPSLLLKTLEFADTIQLSKGSVALAGPGYRAMIAVANA